MTYTTSLRLNRTWLSNADNALDSITVGTQRDNATFTQTGQVRQFGSGRRQASRGPSYSRTVPVTCIGLSFDDAMWLEQHIGTTILYRSASGDIYYGSYFELTGRPNQNSSMYDGVVRTLSFDLYETDYIAPAV